MRTRQLRLNDPDQIRRRLPEFLGKKINIVLKDNTVMFGELMKVNTNEIILQNMRLENARFPLESIAEAYFDTTV